MNKRLNITISFQNHKELYDYVNKQPNSSYYIRSLVKKDIEEYNNQPKTSNKNDRIKKTVEDMIDW